mmetsp:Transcript_24458/g.46831  ORF Transcript_24458/g.46831 Transcript_24458/m.46831 type:complete len:117 (-) Transcript_24458:10-360(-)
MDARSRIMRFCSFWARLFEYAWDVVYYHLQRSSVERSTRNKIISKGFYQEGNDVHYNKRNYAESFSRAYHPMRKGHHRVNQQYKNVSEEIFIENTNNYCRLDATNPVMDHDLLRGI